MAAIASGHGVVSGSAAFWASCAAAAPIIAANVNSATVILACCMRFPSCVSPCPACGYLAYGRETKLQDADSRSETAAVRLHRMLSTTATQHGQLGRHLRRVTQGTGGRSK